MLMSNLVTQVCTIMRQKDSESSTQGSKRLKSFLNSLYCLICSSMSYDVTQAGTWADETCFKLKFEDTVALSNVLFQELRHRLLLSSPETSMDRDVVQAKSYFDQRDFVEELLLLLRCCVLMVRLNANDLNVMKGFQVAVALPQLLPFQEILTRIQIGHVSFTEVPSSQSIFGCTTSFSDDTSAKSSDSYLSFLKRMLEVFLDEMFADKPFRECIAMLDSFSSKEGKLSICSSMHIETVVDVIAAHFLLSVSVDQALATFTQNFIWIQKQTLHLPELSLTAAISLVNHPVMSSSILLHAHLISLVSEVIGVTFAEVVPNVKYTDVYLSAFYDSVILYCGQLSKLRTDSCNNLSVRKRTVWRPFKTHFSSELYDKVNIVLTDWESSWRTHFGNMFTKINSNLASDAISYVKMNLNIFDESSRDEMFSFLSSLVGIISTQVVDGLLLRIKEMTIEDFCLLASILKLMSCSMLKAVCCLKPNMSCMKSSSKKKDVEGCQSLVNMMSCFRQYDLHVPIQAQQLIVDTLKLRSSSYVDTNMILMHFAGLLSLCTATGLDFLVRGCVFMMMVVMNVLIFDGNTFDIEFLRSSNNTGPESQAHAFSPVNVTSVSTSTIEDPFGTIGELRIRKISSRRVASDFQRIRQLRIRSRQTAKTRNGVSYLSNFIHDLEVIDELADFIECEVGKDYTAYVVNRAKLRHKRSIKNARRQWKRKKKMCSFMVKGNRRKST